MQATKLRVRAREGALVQNYERLDQGINCFLGYTFQEVEPGRHGFVAMGDAIEVPYRAEYAKALRDGDLLPADAETAKAVGLKFSEPKSASDDAAPKGGK